MVLSILTTSITLVAAGLDDHVLQSVVARSMCQNNRLMTMFPGFFHCVLRFNY